MKKLSAVMSGLSLFFVRVVYALPTYTDTTGLSGGLSNLANWLCFGIGPGLAMIAFAIFGVRLMNGDKEAWPHSKNLIIGTLVIALAGLIGRGMMALSGVTSTN